MNVRIWILGGLTGLMVTLLYPLLAADAEKAKPDPVLVEFRSRMAQALEKNGLRPTFEFPTSNKGKTLVVRHKTRSYAIHSRNKAGERAQTTTQREGPANDGFLLRAHIQILGQVNQAAVPQTLNRPYWKLSLQVYEVPKANKQIYFALAHNTRTDKEVTRLLHETAAALGQKSAPKPDTK